MQTDVTLDGKYIKGTLKFIEGGIAQTGPLAGDGYFLALQFSGTWSAYDSIKVGLDPSASGMGLVELINDPDKNGVFKITDKNAQCFKVVSTKGTQTKTDTYYLSSLTLEDRGA